MNKKGSILIVSLWAISLLAVMTGSLTFCASQHLIQMKQELADLESKADFISGLNAIAMKITEDPEPHEDSVQKAWFGEVALEAPWKDRLTVRVQDEESKMNLNQATTAQLQAFFKILEDKGKLKSSRKKLVKGITKQRSVHALVSLEELLLMEDFEAEDLETLRPYVTVYPDAAALNLNTAQDIVLQSLVESLPGDHASRLLLIGRLGEACKSGCSFRSADLTPARFSEILKLPKTPLMASLVQIFLSAVTVDSETFHIEMAHPSGHKAEGVFRLRAGQRRPEVLWWRE